MVSERLAAPFSYDDGFTRFDPPAVAFTPKVSSSEAYQIFLNTGVYRNAPLVSTPQFFLADYTTYGQGDASDNGLGMGHDRLPVWVIRFTNVPDDPGGPGGSGTGSPPASVSAPVLHDIVAIVDADTGTLLDVLSDLPDAQAQPAPPATAPGTGKPSTAASGG